MPRKRDRRPKTGSAPQETPAAAEAAEPKRLSTRAKLLAAAALTGGLLAALSDLAGTLELFGVGKERFAPEVQAARVALDGYFAANDDPATPRDCATVDPALLPKLEVAAALLRDGKAGGKRPQDLDALRALTELESTNPPSAEYWALLANAQLQSGVALADTLKSTRMASSLCPALAAAHNLAGSAHLLAGDHAAAEEAFRLALAREPTYAAARFNLALLFLQEKLPERAIEYASALIAERPHHKNALLVRGQAFLAAGRAEDARADLRRAVADTPDNALAHLALGQAEQRAGDAGAARAAFCRAKQLGHPAAAALCEEP